MVTYSLGSFLFLACSLGGTNDGEVRDYLKANTSCSSNPNQGVEGLTFLVFSVFPAPDSPVISMDWFSRSETLLIWVSSIE